MGGAVDGSSLKAADIRMDVRDVPGQEVQKPLEGYPYEFSGRAGQDAADEAGRARRFGGPGTMVFFCTSRDIHSAAIRPYGIKGDHENRDKEKRPDQAMPVRPGVVSARV